MADPALFIGVISHVGSRFARSQGPDGLAARLAGVLADHGQPAEVAVNTADLLPPGATVTNEMIQQSLTAQLHLDKRWASYLRDRQSPRWWAIHAARWGRSFWNRLSPPSTQTVRRLLNIELSHLDLMERGIASGAPWVLILEDDADCADIADLATGLLGFMRTAEQTKPGFINISQSFSTAELGIDHLLQPTAVQWVGPVPREVLAASRPVTNTVCAIAYSREFLTELVAVMEALPTQPVVPIDWKLNLALMQMFDAGQIAAGTCWLVEPAPIVQMSMQPTGILPS